MSRGLAGTFGDLVLAARSLARVPSFTAVAVGLLALGVGATTAVFGVAWTVVWRPLPLPEPDRLVWTMLQDQEGATPASPRVYLHWHETSSTLDSLGAVHDGSATLGGDADRGIVPERVALLRATADLFTALDAPPAAGRLFDATDAQPGGEPVVVLGHGLWQRRFVGDPAIIDHTIDLDGVAHRVLGVLDPALDGLLPGADLIVPLRLGAAQRDNRAGYLALIGRLNADASIAQAADELDRLLVALDDPDAPPRTAAVEPLAEAFYGDVRPQLGLLFAAVLGVAAIGCGNLAILLLARGTARTREIGLRRALGAGRARIARLLVAEGIVLGVLGALSGAVLAHAGVDALRRLVLPVADGQIPRIGDARVDLVALGVAAALGIATAILASLAPIWRAARLDPRSALAGGRGTTGGRDRLRAGLIAAEVALSVMLLVVAGLLGRSLLALQHVDSGFRPDRVLSAQLALPKDDYPTMATAMATYDRVVERLAALPGVDAAAVVSRAPFAGGSPGLDFAFEGESFDPQLGRAVQSRLRLVGADSFGVLGVPLLAGRDLAATDTAERERVVVINRSLARRLGTPPGDEDTVVGRTLVSNGSAFVDADGGPMPWRIVGVVGDIRDQGPRSLPEPAVHFALGQMPPAPWEWMGRQMVLLLRTTIPPERLIDDLRQAVVAEDAKLPVYGVRTLDTGMANALIVERSLLVLLTALGAIGLLLSAAGLYAVVAYFVGRRRREIGIRMALGASVDQIRRHILGLGLRPVLAGLALGLVAVAWLGRAVESFLYGVTPWDPTTFVGTAALLVATAALACWIPSGAAARVDPASALDCE